MDFLKNLFEIRDMVYALAAFGITFLAICVLIFISRLIRNVWDAHREKQLRVETGLIFQWLEHDDSRILKKIRRNKFVAEKISLLGVNFSGEERHRLVMLYSMLGFTKADFRGMQGFSKKARSKAFVRCRRLLIPIPREGWRILLTSKSPLFRWAVMEYLIELKGEKATPWVYYYSLQQNDRNKGIVLHLFSALAKKYPEALPIILDFTDEEFLIEQALRVLSAYPTPSAQGAIIRALDGTSTTETIIAAIKALGVCPDEKSLAVYRNYCNHKNWVVRLMIAQGLVNFQDTDSLAILEELTLDSSYFVRRNAVISLLELAPESQDILDDILSDSDHPSYLLAAELLPEVEVAAA